MVVENGELRQVACVPEGFVLVADRAEVAELGQTLLHDNAVYAHVLHYTGSFFGLSEEEVPREGEAGF